MAQNDIEDMLDQLRRIKSGGNLNSVKIDQIVILEVEIRFLRTFIKCNHVVSPDSLVKITKIAQLIMEKVHSVFDGIPDEYKNNHNLERGVLTLLESVQGNTNLRYNYELNDSDMSEYMDCLDKNLRMMFLQWGSLSDPSWTNEEILVRNQFFKETENHSKENGIFEILMSQR
ncbi:hypothetical protein R3W88_025949 [Solanum pinnatisectum]|uniref:Uncharacterized protein n=1 Tax=Solanum pinnatisectum TaxID=50273 RepID=A0AAV9M563_9SOLN|nr:hypothetical protein R3W88_025949 [Solanum pinnatisectum]